MNSITSNYIIIPILSCLLVLFLSTSCKERSSTYNSYQDSETYEDEDDKDISELSCDELQQLVLDDGYQIEELSSYDMNSSALNYIALYEYDGTSYVIASFNSGGTYIYCDVDRSAWNSFTENEEQSYGSAFHNHLSYYTCDCN